MAYLNNLFCSWPISSTSSFIESEHVIRMWLMLRKYLMRLQFADTGCAIYQENLLRILSENFSSRKLTKN